MKTLIKLSTLVAACFISTACDGEADAEANAPFDGTALQESFESLGSADFFKTDPDLIRSPAPLGERNIYVEGTEAADGEVNFFYQRTGDHTYSFTSDRTGSVIVDSAVVQLLSASNLGNRFRDLIQSDTGEFSEEVLQEMAEEGDFAINRVTSRPFSLLSQRSHPLTPDH